MALIGLGFFDIFGLGGGGGGGIPVSPVSPLSVGLSQWNFAQG